MRMNRPSYALERALLDVWARWVRRSRYAGAPTKPKCVLDEMIELGIRTGPVRYTDEDVDVDAEAERVDSFMAGLRQTDSRVHAALIARHLREFTDTKGRTWRDATLPERLKAQAMYGTDRHAALRMFRRDCDAGYQLLARY